jgi:hypothetical protein
VADEPLTKVHQILHMAGMCRDLVLSLNFWFFVALSEQPMFKHCNLQELRDHLLKAVRTRRRYYYFGFFRACLLNWKGV